MAKSAYSKKDYWRARLKKVIFPALSLLLFFSILIQVGEGSIEAKSILNNMMKSAWFIDVIVLEYVFYSVAHKIADEDLQLVVIILMNIMLAYVFKTIGLDERWYNAMLLFPVGIFMSRHEQSMIPVLAKKVTGIIGLVIFVVLGIFASGLKGMMIAVCLKTIAGVGLAVAVCSFLYRVCIDSAVLEYIGKRSLYYYIVHAELILLLNDWADDFTIVVVCMIIILTIILSEICNRLSSKENLSHRGE